MPVTINQTPTPPEPAPLNRCPICGTVNYGCNPLNVRVA